MTLTAGSARAEGETRPDVSKLSIEELGELQVTSVSKRPEAVSQAASAIYVITHEEIARSGARNIPEILRLAPNLEVFQKSASDYVITARGFNGAPAAQNFSNKLLVLIDGRSVYTPLFSGVYWDMLDVLPQDIERIEVISGPGATLWGANAVNGVINVITRKAEDTQGGMVRIAGREGAQTGSLRFGGKLGDAIGYRLYAKTTQYGDTRTAVGGPADDHWGKTQLGFRLDWAASPIDAVTLQGDAYAGYEAQIAAPSEDIRGRNLTLRWNRAMADGGSLQVQAYYDRALRGAEVDGSGFQVDTYDVDLQHAFSLGARNDIVWGGGVRANRYRIDGTATLKFEPPGRTLTLGNLFVQDSITLTPSLKAVLGAKLEDDAYVGAVLLPNARLSWSPGTTTNLWAAVSRAVRSPTPFDRDVVEISGGARFLTGAQTFRSEDLTAYEAGLRVQPFRTATLSLSTYFNQYDDLRSIEVTPTTFIPLHWGNGMKGHTYGLEAWGEYLVAPWWRLAGSVNLLQEKFAFKPGASGLLGPSQAADDPKYQAALKSSMDFGRVTLDAAFRYVGAQPNPRVPSYVELNGKLGWRLTDHLDLSLVGRNLLHERHLEYVQGNYIPRSVFADLEWRF